MSKVSIKDLENIVLEGGGAKGAAYAGAIEGIEYAFWKVLGADFSNCDGEGIAILDYGKHVGAKFIPQVKLFGGSSAGAITSMALALGFSADEIKNISDFEFSKFLTDRHSGKYRMIAQDGSPMIAEDHKGLMGVGKHAKPYEFALNKAQKVHADLIKESVRGAILGLIKDVLVRGLVEKLPNVKALYQKLFQGGNKGKFDLSDYFSWYGAISGFTKLIINLFVPGKPGVANSPTQLVGFPPGTPVQQATKEGIVKGIKEALDLWIFKLAKKSEMNFNFSSIGNVVWDRGLFSGFAVREFFFDMMLYACVKNTHFKRRYFTDPADRDLLKNVEMTMKDGRLKAKFSELPENIKKKLADLPKMTFKEFYDLTDITLVICVSNFSTDQPIYFSPYWTPDFPVLEAVGASMTIPPAIRPVYNEANVFVLDNADQDLYAMSKDAANSKKAGEKEYFNFDEYYMDAVAIKAFLSTYYCSYIDTNNSIGFHGHLNYLRRYLEEMKEKPGISREGMVNGVMRRLTDSHFIYHYNAAYKGLLLDGGYRNNIPYNVLRTEMYKNENETYMLDPELTKTLAIKLDENFPREWVSEVYGVLAETHKKLGSPKFLAKEERSILGKVLRANFRVLITSSEKRAQKQLMDMEDIRTMNDESFERVAACVANLYGELTEKNRQPWNKKKSILMTAFEGYAYGSGDGQVRYLSDHDHILPLYSYGVDTFDFNLKKIEPLVTLSKKKSESRVLDYFEIKRE